MLVFHGHLSIQYEIQHEPKLAATSTAKTQRRPLTGSRRALRGASKSQKKRSSESEITTFSEGGNDKTSSVSEVFAAVFEAAGGGGEGVKLEYFTKRSKKKRSPKSTLLADST